MKGSTILLAGEPRGIFLEGIVQGTPYPGTIMSIVAGLDPIGGEFTWEEAAMSADGDPRSIVVLLEDKLQGFSYLAPYVNGTRCFMYAPLIGEQMNVRAAAQVGTGSANAYTVGERMIVQHNSGLLIATATSSENAPFTCLEHIDVPADESGLIWCMRT